jgi:RNA polymerase sigma-70 factor (ECF subfamily)
MRRVADGDVSAIGVLYDRHGPMLFPMALRILRDRAQAEDALHDAFLTVATRASQYTCERGSVAVWLVALVRNLSIDRTRRRHRRGSIERQRLAHEPPSAVESPDQGALNADDNARLCRALASLPDVQRMTLESAFFEGLTYSQIAAREHVPLGTIKSRANRAIVSMREALARESEGPDRDARGRVLA